MSNRRFVHTYTLEAEFDGAGGLVADPYPLYPRAFLWAHLDDGVMETVVTNWGNDGLYMEGVGPSLVGRVIPGLGPLQQIYLGGALYFDANGNLSYDPTALQTQIAQLQAQVTALQAQVQADETNYNAQLSQLTTRATASETAIVSLQATVFSLQNQIYQINQTALFKPTANAALTGSGALTTALRMPTLLTLPIMQAVGNLYAAPGFQLPAAVLPFAATGNQTAVLGMVRNIGAAMSGAGTSNVDLTQIFSNLKQITPASFAGTGGAALSKLAEQLAVPAVLAGSGSLSINLLVALRGLSTLAGVGVFSARLIQTQLYSAALAGAGGGNANPSVLPAASGWNPASIVNGTLSNNNKTATATGTSGGALGQHAPNSGKLYFEVTLDAVARSFPSVGVCTSSYVMFSTLGADQNSYGVAGSNTTYGARFNNASVGTVTDTPSNGDVIGIAIDFTAADKMYAHVNGVWFNGVGPSGTPDVTPPYSQGTPLSPVCTLDNSQIAAQCTIRTTAPFSYAIPTGYSAWG